MMTMPEVPSLQDLCEIHRKGFDEGSVPEMRIWS